VIDFGYIEQNNLKNEIKYYLVFCLKNHEISANTLFANYKYQIKILVDFIQKYHREKESLKKIIIRKERWKLFLINKGYSVNKNNELKSHAYRKTFKKIPMFFKNFYDEQEEIQKDIWDLTKIESIKNCASKKRMKVILNFEQINKYYREMIKKYFLTIITKRSASHCRNILTKIIYFFNYFYSHGYDDEFLENLNREDMEKYYYQISKEFHYQNATYRSKYVSQIRMFLEYIQIAQYKKAPKIATQFLIFSDDIPKRETRKSEVEKAKFIPKPIITQIDNNIKYLDRPKYIEFYILLRESGWRGTDILNLRYDNCLEKVWDSDEEKYYYLLCGNITKTGIENLKIPIADGVSEIIRNKIKSVKEKSNKRNNPNKYLFNTFEGKRTSLPLSLPTFVNSIRRLIETKDIRFDGELYHFTIHQLRHTRAHEYIEQGISLVTIQEILGHTSLQMTLHYAKISENKMYKEWQKAEKLEIFKLNEEIDEAYNNSDDQIINYKNVRSNLDSIKVPFGTCFKPSKITCKQQINQCFNCGSFCTTTMNKGEYEAEIIKVKEQIKLSKKLNRKKWIDLNEKYLETLEEMIEKIDNKKIIHKNSNSREVQND
jgi:integrase